MSNPSKPYTILLLMKATSKWLSLSRKGRRNFFARKVMPIFQQVANTVKVSLFDSEYFHSGISDFMIVSTSNLHDYQLMIELLRDSEVYSEPFFEISDIIIGQENLFHDFDELLINPNQKK
jgi:hypothetical protein